jgi:hypothetical protein
MLSQKSRKKWNLTLCNRKKWTNGENPVKNLVEHQIPHQTCPVDILKFEITRSGCVNTGMKPGFMI